MPVFHGTAGNDTIDGTTGDDTFYTSTGQDLIQGGGGVDTLIADFTAAAAAYADFSLSDSGLFGVIGDRDTTWQTSFARMSHVELDTGAGDDQIRIDFNRTTPDSTLDVVAGDGFDFLTLYFRDPLLSPLVGNAATGPLTGGGITISGIEQFYLELAGGNDDLVLVAGDDVVFAGGGGDRILAMGGNDMIEGGLGADYLDGGDGDDFLTGDAGDDQLIGGAGNDRLIGGGGNDRFLGGDGDDRLEGGAGNDMLTGGLGDDFHFVDSGDIVVEGASEGTGDRVFASTSYVLTPGAYVEIMSTTNHAGTAAINLDGNALNNLIYGNAGDNSIDGKAGADTMAGFGGNDWFYVDNAGDRVVEGASEGAGDRVFASASWTLSAGAHVEFLSTANHAGTAAIDLSGNELGNLIFGNAGSNLLDGKGGNDTLSGFGGVDRFTFTTTLGTGNVDRIADFDADDLIALDDAVFTGLGLGALSANAFRTGTGAQDADDRIVYNQATGQLYYDADGNGAGAQMLFATLSGSPVLTASDFIVI